MSADDGKKQTPDTLTQAGNEHSIGGSDTNRGHSSSFTNIEVEESSPGEVLRFAESSDKVEDRPGDVLRLAENSDKEEEQSDEDEQCDEEDSLEPYRSDSEDEADNSNITTSLCDQLEPVFLDSRLTPKPKIYREIIENLRPAIVATGFFLFAQSCIELVHAVSCDLTSWLVKRMLEIFQDDLQIENLIKEVESEYGEGSQACKLMWPMTSSILGISIESEVSFTKFSEYITAKGHTLDGKSWGILTLFKRTTALLHIISRCYGKKAYSFFVHIINVKYPAYFAKALAAHDIGGRTGDVWKPAIKREVKNFDSFFTDEFLNAVVDRLAEWFD